MAQLPMLYFIRHGQTDANLHHLNAGGEWDVPLNVTGETQARDFALGNQDFLKTIHKFYISPMIRAQQTAKQIIDNLTHPIDTETVPDLAEWYLGEWSGKPYAETPDYFL